MHKRIQKIKKVLVEKPFLFFLFFFLYLIITIVINQIYVTYVTLFGSKLWYVIPYLGFNLFIAFLVALNFSLFFIKLKELRLSSGVSLFGVFGGFLGGACPSCLVGIFPTFLGFFGFSGSLSRLPFFGLEILALSVVFLLIGTWYLTQENTCKIR